MNKVALIRAGVSVLAEMIVTALTVGFLMAGAYLSFGSTLAGAAVALVIISIINSRQRYREFSKDNGKD